MTGFKALGYPLECAFATDKATRVAVLLKEMSHDISYSEVPPIATIGAWLVLTIFFYWRDRRSRQ